MIERVNVYCDESCHLPNDQQTVMTLGALWCPLEKTREIAVRLREIKQRHGLPASFEVKWNKISPAKVQLYLDLVDYFFDDDDLHFRAWVADKRGLDHDSFDQDHDDWYYKMMFGLLEPVLRPDARFRIYLDKKDTRSARKVEKLHDVVCNNLYDFDRGIVEWIQIVESHVVEQLQLADLLIGAMSYVSRELSGNSAKEALIRRIRMRSGYKLDRATLLRESKFNLFFWRGRRSGAQV